MSAVLVLVSGFAALAGWITLAAAGLLCVMAVTGWIGFRPQRPDGPGRQPDGGRTGPSRFGWLTPAGGFRRGRVGRLGRIGCVLSGLGLAAGTAMVTAIETVGFDPAMRVAAGWLDDRDGLLATFDDVSGSLLRGQLRVGGLLLQQREPRDGGTDLRIDRLEIDSHGWLLLPGRAVIGRVALVGVDGTLAMPSGPARPAGGDRAGGNLADRLAPTVADPMPVLPRPVTVKRFDLRQASLLVRRGADRRTGLGIRVARWSATDLSESNALYRLVLLGVGEVGIGRGSIASTRIDGPVAPLIDDAGGVTGTEWTLTDIPGRSLGQIAGGVTRLFRAGRFSGTIVHVHSAAPGAPQGAFSARGAWRLQAVGLDLAVPRDLAAALATDPATRRRVDSLNRLPPAAVIAFRYEVPVASFNGRRSLPATGYGRAVTGAMLARIATAPDG